MTWGLDFWQWAALTGLGLTGLGVVLAGVGLWASTRQTRAITGQIGATAQLTAEAEARTQTTLAQMQTATQTTLGQMEDRARTTLAQMEARTQATLAQMDATTQDTLRTLGEGQTRLGEILAQMDRAAEQRAQDLKDRLGGEAET
jgi:hypothetical protein